MLPSSKSPQEQPATYTFHVRGNNEDLQSLQRHDQMLTDGMGGVLPEQPDAARFRYILDIGCGTGGWLINLAKSYLLASELVGIDINERLITYARTEAATQQVSERVQFLVMDALQYLAFPPNYFDLVNQRIGTSYLRTWTWPDFLDNLERITAPGGIIRLTEVQHMESNSSAFNQLSALFQKARYQAGHAFGEHDQELTDEIISILTRRNIQRIQTRSSLLEYRAGTPEGQRHYEEMKVIFRMFQPFVLKWLRVDDYELLCKQALDEMQQADFVAIWELVTIWGHKQQ